MSEVKFSSLKELWNATWETREAGEAELKKAGFAIKTAEYELVEMGTGQWHLAKPMPTVVVPIRKSGDPIRRRPGEPVKRDARVNAAHPPPRPPAAVRSAAPPRGKGGGPNDAALPPGFHDWLLAEIKKNSSIYRRELQAKSGQKCRWEPWLVEWGKTRGYTVKLVREGRQARFAFTKA